MVKPKLTKAMSKVLERMEKGGKLTYGRVPGSWYLHIDTIIMYQLNCRLYPIQSVTAKALLKKCFIKPKRKTSRVLSFKTTLAGRRALRGGG